MNATAKASERAKSARVDEAQDATTWDTDRIMERLADLVGTFEVKRDGNDPYRFYRVEFTTELFPGAQFKAVSTPQQPSVREAALFALRGAIAWFGDTA
jgi:hypothetical protein